MYSNNFKIKIVTLSLLVSIIATIIPTSNLVKADILSSKKLEYHPNLYQDEVGVNKIIDIKNKTKIFREINNNELLNEYKKIYGVIPEKAYDVGKPNNDPSYLDVSNSYDGDINTHWRSNNTPKPEYDWDDGYLIPNWSHSQVIFTLPIDQIGEVTRVALRGPDGVESGTPLEVHIYEADKEYEGNPLLTKVGYTKLSSPQVGDFIEIQLNKKLTKPYVYLRVTKTDASILRFSEVAFLKDDKVKKSIDNIFQDDNFAKLNPDITEQSLTNLETEIKNHPLENMYQNQINVAKSILNKEIRPDRFAMKLEPLGDVEKFKIDNQLNMAPGYIQPIGYSADAGSKITVYAKADSNGTLPKIGFGQVGLADTAASPKTKMKITEIEVPAIGAKLDGMKEGEFEAGYTQLKEGKNIITLPNRPINTTDGYGRIYPYAIYFIYSAESNEISNLPEVRVSGPQLKAYPIFREGIDSFEVFKNEVNGLKNDNKHNMSEILTKYFHYSTTNTSMKDIINYDGFNLEVLRTIEEFILGVFEFSGITKNEIKGKFHMKDDTGQLPSGAVAVAMEQFVRVAKGASIPMMQGQNKGYSKQILINHEMFHQVSNKYLDIWESVEVMAESLIEVYKGKEPYSRTNSFGNIDEFFNFLGSKGLGQFDTIMDGQFEYTMGRYSQGPVFLLPFIYLADQKTNPFGSYFYKEAATLLQSGNHDIPLNPILDGNNGDNGDVGQNWIMTFSYVTGYDLRDYFKLFNAPIKEKTNSYIEKKINDGTIKPATEKMQKMNLVIPKTGYLREINAPIFNEKTKISLNSTINDSKTKLTLNMKVNEKEESVMAYEIYKKNDLGEFEYWGMSRNETFIINQELDPKNHRYINLTDDRQEFYAIGYDYELNPTQNSNIIVINNDSVTNEILLGGTSDGIISTEITYRNKLKFNQSTSNFINTVKNEMPYNDEFINVDYHKVEIYSNEKIKKYSQIAQGQDTGNIFNNLSLIKIEPGDIIRLWSKEPNNRLSITGDVIDATVDYKANTDKDYTNKVFEVTDTTLREIYNSEAVIDASDKVVSIGSPTSVLKANVTAHDDRDSNGRFVEGGIDITKNLIIANEADINLNVAGEYPIIYEVTDSWGRVSRLTKTVTVKSNTFTASLNQSKGGIMLSTAGNGLRFFTTIENIDPTTSAIYYITTASNKDETALFEVKSTVVKGDYSQLKTSIEFDELSKLAENTNTNLYVKRIEKNKEPEYSKLMPGDVNLENIFTISNRNVNIDISALNNEVILNKTVKAENSFVQGVSTISWNETGMVVNGTPTNNGSITDFNNSKVSMMFKDLNGNYIKESGTNTKIEVRGIYKDGKYKITIPYEILDNVHSFELRLIGATMQTTDELQKGNITEFNAGIKNDKLFKLSADTSNIINLQVKQSANTSKLVSSKITTDKESKTRQFSITGSISLPEIANINSNVKYTIIGTHGDKTVFEQEATKLNNIGNYNEFKTNISLDKLKNTNLSKNDEITLNLRVEYNGSTTIVLNSTNEEISITDKPSKQTFKMTSKDGKAIIIKK